MEQKDLKSYIAFIFIALMFIIATITCVAIVIKYKNISSTPATEYEKSFEITLPVIEWGKYESLSKKLPNGKIEQNNK